MVRLLNPTGTGHDRLGALPTAGLVAATERRACGRALIWAALYAICGCFYSILATFGMDHPVMGDDGNSAMSRLRVAAVNAAEALTAYRGDDPAELVALA
jgi:hypothetical protein